MTTQADKLLALTDDVVRGRYVVNYLSLGVSPPSPPPVLSRFAEDLTDEELENLKATRQSYRAQVAEYNRVYEDATKRRRDEFLTHLCEAYGVPKNNKAKKLLDSCFEYLGSNDYQAAIKLFGSFVSLL